MMADAVETQFMELPWSEPRKVNTSGGVRFVANCALTPEAEALLSSAPHVAQRLGIQVTSFKGNLQLTRWRGMTAQEAEAMNREIEASMAVDADIFIPAPSKLNYYGYQRAGVAFALGRESTLLADDMGLGKTPQAIGVINSRPDIMKILIVCPAALRFNWKQELSRWLCRELTVGMAEADRWPDDCITIISYEAAVKQIEKIKATAWDLFVADEAHYLKNPESQRTRAILGYHDRKADLVVSGVVARRKMLLTGTPFENRPIEIFPLIHYLAPEEFPSRFAFAKRYCDAKKKKIGRDKKTGKVREAWDYKGSSNLAELQQRLRSTIMIRRKKSEVLLELPPKRRHVVVLTSDCLGGVVTKEHSAYSEWEQRKEELEAITAKNAQKAYTADTKKLREEVDLAFDELTRARHETALKKIPAAIEYLKIIVESDPFHKVIVFGYHRDVLEALHAEFKDRSVMVIGGVSDEAKHNAVQRFQTEPEVQFLFGNIQAAGVGHNMTASSHVVFVEFPWDPGKLNQAEDRAHRNGQRRSVLVEHLVLDGSVDVKMLADIFEKQSHIDQALDVPASAIAARPGDASIRASEVTPFSERQRASVHSALRLLAEVGDRGINGFDAYLIERLAEMEQLDDRQAALGRKLVIRNRKHLSAEAYRDAMDEKAEPPPLVFSGDGPITALAGEQGSFAFAG